MQFSGRELSDTYVLENIAGFDLKAVRANSLEVEMRIIGSKLPQETSVISVKIRYAEFNYRLFENVNISCR